jgi:hypothetical protein
MVTKKRKYTRKPKVPMQRVFSATFGFGWVKQVNGRYTRTTAGGHVVRDVAFDDGILRTVLLHVVQPDDGREEAADILGVRPNATPQEIHSAYNTILTAGPLASCATTTIQT